MPPEIDPTQIDDSTLPFSAGVQGTTESAADSVSNTESPASSVGASGVAEVGSAVGGSGGAAAAATADPNSGASAAAQQWQSIREAAQQYGYQFDPGIADDRAALAHLIQQANAARQANYYAQVGQAIVPHAAEVQQFLQQRQQPKAEKSPWDEPEFNPKWSALVQFDPQSGAYIGKASNVPAEVVRAANDYAAWRDRIERDPVGFQNHVFETKFAPKIRDMIQAEKETIRREAIVDNIVKQNASWLYQRGEDGSTIFGQNGQPVLSPAGQRYAQMIQRVSRLGVKDPEQQDALAREYVALEIQAAQAQSGVAQSQQTQNAVARPQRNVAGTQRPTMRANDPAAVEPSASGVSLRDYMSRAFDEEGLTDADINFDR